jgi:hypothetical protein
MGANCRCRSVSRSASQKPVRAWPSTSSMTKKGWPVGVMPASKTLAMLGWSMRARACRSCSNRASTDLESIPALTSFTATGRFTGSDCWAAQTEPMPPSPISSMSV